MKEVIRQRALDLGFDACGVSAARRPDGADRLMGWLEAGRHGEMAWMARTADRRANPRAVLPGAASVVVVAASYHRPPPDPAVGGAAAGGPLGVVARYARFQDYHEVLAGPLEELRRFIEAAGGPDTRALAYIDTGPVLERDLAQRAGLGFIGKHTNLIRRDLGNWFFLGAILTTLELEPDSPERNRCGACTRCLAACPTAAIVAPFELDARRCIAYLTIELKGPIPVEWRPAIGARVFGCDDCLEVCPWNRFARVGRLMREAGRSELGQPDLIEALGLDETTFRRRFAGTPLLRSKRRGFLRNVCVALGNKGDAEALPALARAAADPEPLIAEHARWAIGRIEDRVRPA